ncbi:ATP-binding protein [Streptomyces sp. ISL-66]|uniref:ATP-binding protein n=1 Tax=Streptomyces sp. ISL-66 TaxID=2819186 RepID=UPI001BE96EEB|nr:ATP-binding protein [Streptomyces sp. ISL-66]MBT2472147.1 ATP-binding protein [Streptomyces sp. ISL-66]
MDTMRFDVATLHSPTAVAGAREGTLDFLDGLTPPVGAEARDTAILVVSELVTNALRHGGGTYTLRLTVHPGIIEVAVKDPSPHPPRMRTPDLVDGSGGFGWPMVNQLATATVITPTPEGGKTVRALIPRG